MSAFRWKMHEQGGIGSLFHGRFGDYRISVSPASKDLLALHRHDLFALWRRPKNGPDRGRYVLVRDDFASQTEAILAAEADYAAVHKAK
jgi:hypothetical protein